MSKIKLAESVLQGKLREDNVRLSLELYRDENGFGIMIKQTSVK